MGGGKSLFRLFYQTTSLKTFTKMTNLDYSMNAFQIKPYQLKSEKCSGGKLSKIRITGLTAANAVGDKLTMFVIGKVKKPQCFNNVKFLPCRYRNQQKSWIDRELFEERVREMDKKFVYEGRKVALVIGNCPVHPQIENLKSIKLFFLSLNTTSQTQPMDQGVTRLLKLYYRKNVVRKMIRIVEKKNTLSKISFLLGMQMLCSLELSTGR